MKRLKRGRLLSMIAVAILAFIVGSAGRGQPVYAQAEGGITLSAGAGFDGFCKEDAWIPVRVTVANSGPDVNGRVQLSYKRGPDPAEALLAQDLVIPTTSRKEVIFYAYPPRGNYSMVASLIVDGKSVASTKLGRGCLVPENMLFGVLADRPAVYDQLRDISLVRGRNSVAHLRLTDLPDQPQGWTGLDGLIVSNADTSSLTDAQREALKLWLAGGGKLLVVGGAQWQATAAGLQDVLPVDITATENVADLSALPAYLQAGALSGPAVAARSRAHPEAEVLVAQAGLPLVVAQQVGFGRVLFVAVDPSLEPLSNWDGMRSFYSQLLAVHATRPGWTTMPWAADPSNRALSSLPELSLPSTAYICGWLVLYIVVIGPLNFLILRRRKRSEWAWFSIPALVILFTAGSYFYGGLFRGGQPILNRLAVVQAWDGSQQAQVHGLVGVYSPGRASYTVKAADQFLLYPFETESNSTMLQDGQAVAMQDVRVEIAGMKAITAEGSVQALPISHSLVLKLGDRDPRLQGSVTNNSSYTLREASLVTSGDWQELGDLAPGESATVNLSLTPSPSGPAFYSTSPSSLLHTLPYGGAANDDEARRTALMDVIVAAGDQGNWGIYLMGWTDRPMLPVSVQGRKFRAIDTSLYVLQLNPSLAYTDSAVRLTPGLLAWDTSQPGASPFSRNFYGSTDYVLSFHPGVPIEFRSVRELTLDVDTSNSGNVLSQVVVSLWDFTRGQWAPQDSLSWGRNQILHPEPYVGPGGEVRLRVEGQSNSYVGINRSAITLVVNR